MLSQRNVSILKWLVLKSRCLSIDSHFYHYYDEMIVLSFEYGMVFQIAFKEVVSATLIVG